MDFKSGKKSISGLFSCKKQFIIPRFQREYTWDKIELNEFLDDILSRICIIDKKLDTTEYFWGSLLLVGDLDDQKVLDVEVVDGQQRITTMTIFLSVIAKYFLKEHEEGLSEALWEYIIGKDANTHPFAILKNETPKPFFQFIIQKIVEEKIEPKNTEEEKILKANRFFKTNLSKTGLIKRLKRLRKDDCCSCNYVDLLKAIRDQLLRSFVICISTTNKEYANMIFEILNAKGKELASVDLIKNSIFEVLDGEVPADTAKEIWLQIRNNLCSRSMRVEFATFYRHFWISHYGKVQDNKLYSDFQKKIQKNEASYLAFLKEMELASRYYSILLKPNLETDFKNKKEYNFVISEFNTLNNVFGIVQVRPILLSLLHLHIEKQILSYKLFKRIIKSLSAFHFVYNAICSRRTSSLETPLNTFAYELYKSTNDDQIASATQQFKTALKDLLPPEEDFIENFALLKYSKSNMSTNMLAKYVVAKWQCLLDNSDMVPPDSSIEHIKDETDDLQTKEIGNLLLLEQSINSTIPNGLSFADKKVYYKDSKYKCVQDFITNTVNYSKWDADEIASRNKSLAKDYYSKMLDIIDKTI